MIKLESMWKDVGNRQRWNALAASFVVKVKATKAVWFPPKPAAEGQKAVGAAAKATKKTAKKTTKKSRGAAKKGTSATKRAASSATRKKA